MNWKTSIYVTLRSGYVKEVEILVKKNKIEVIGLDEDQLRKYEMRDCVVFTTYELLRHKIGSMRIVPGQKIEVCDYKIVANVTIPGYDEFGEGIVTLSEKGLETKVIKEPSNFAL
jgi:hypothetical protein